MSEFHIKKSKVDRWLIKVIITFWLHTTEFLNSTGTRHTKMVRNAHKRSAHWRKRRNIRPSKLTPDLQIIFIFLQPLLVLSNCISRLGNPSDTYFIIKKIDNKEISPVQALWINHGVVQKFVLLHKLF